MAERHEKLTRGLALIQRLSSAPDGLSIAELCAEAGVGRRTLERMLRAVSVACPTLEAVPGPRGTKRWRIPQPGPLTPPERAALERAVRALSAEGELESSAALRSLMLRLGATQDAALEAAG